MSSIEKKICSIFVVFVLMLFMGYTDTRAHDDEEGDLGLTCEVTNSGVPTDIEENFISWWWCYDGITENTNGEYEELEELDGKFSLSAEITTVPTESDLEEGFVTLSVSGEISTKDISPEDPLNGVCVSETTAESEGDFQDCDSFMGRTSDWANCHVDDVDLYSVITEGSTQEEILEVISDLENPEFEGEVAFIGDIKTVHNGNAGGPNGNKSNPGHGGGRNHVKVIVECGID